jgi:predicted TIM-barrel fold metal-dependent hydrolase
MQHANGRSALSIVIERDPVVQLGHSDFAADRGRGKHAPAARPIQPTFPKSWSVGWQMADATWRAGFARLAPLNLTFEAWLYHPQLMELADLARAFPQTTIILNHVGGPLGIGPYADKKKETFAAWKAGIAELGKYQNVVVKLGGGHAVRHVRLPLPRDSASEELARAY